MEVKRETKRVRISYEYDSKLAYHYWALGDGRAAGSPSSYEDAKARLLEILQDGAYKGVPEPEEVEI